MRKVLVSLLVLALCAPAMADVTVSVADNGGETAIITMEVTGASVVRGVGLAVQCTNGAKLIDQTYGATDAGLNTFIDYLFANPGTTFAGDTPAQEGHPYADAAGPGEAAVDATDFSICAGALDATGNQGGLGAGTYVVAVVNTGVGDICVSADGLRGGIVGDDLGVVNLETAPVCAPIGPDGCKGDLNDDAKVSGLDLSALVTYLTPHAPLYEVTPVPAGDEKFDLNGDAKVSGLDLSALVTHLTPYAPLYETTDCMP